MTDPGFPRLTPSGFELEIADLRARVEELEGALRKAQQFVHIGYIDCAGDKCRQSNCTACYGDDAVEATDFIDEALKGAKP